IQYFRHFNLRDIPFHTQRPDSCSHFFCIKIHISLLSAAPGRKRKEKSRMTVRVESYTDETENPQKIFCFHAASGRLHHQAAPQHSYDLFD
ncbi:MAG: hypothetical protein LIO86_04990, partial [Lachnospiraceae bacterium]|nr:hypothetical protein [Lachnospiraceae bacterium]